MGGLGDPSRHGSAMAPAINSLLAQLTGGDRRSIGRSAAVVEQVLGRPRLFALVFSGITDADPLVRMRCADVVEKVTAVRPEWLGPFKPRVLEIAAAADEQEVRWHMAQLLSRLTLDAAERRRAVMILEGDLRDRSRIVKTFSMQALADIAAQDSRLRGPIVERLERLTRTGSPAMQSRGRRLLAQLRRPVRDGQSGGR